jgi:hypothetical protein
MARAHERGYPFARQFPLFASAWVDFVDQNKFAEAELAKSVERSAYETGRNDVKSHSTTAGNWSSSPPLAHIDPLPLIERIVQDEVAKRIGTSNATRSQPTPPTRKKTDDGDRKSELPRYRKTVAEREGFGIAGLRPILVRTPFAVLDAVAGVAQILQRPPLTRNQVELMQIDTTASDSRPGFGLLRISPRSLEEELKTMVGPR